MSFFRNSIPHYSEKSYLLSELVTQSNPSRKDYRKFKFGQQHQILFDELKRAAKEYLPLHEIDPTKPLYAFSDASKQSISFAAFQIAGPD